MTQENYGTSQLQCPQFRCAVPATPACAPSVDDCLPGTGRVGHGDRGCLTPELKRLLPGSLWTEPADRQPRRVPPAPAADPKQLGVGVLEDAGAQRFRFHWLG